ncbi:MAG: SAM-dependent DNA methyltransferase [Planctomycetes bacterium]|nr:SAM-dependent DNA methyltransferase [Planctomycetota bacterium]
MTDTSSLVAKLWSYCHVLRDDGLSYLDYLEQLTYLLFLKMADERAELADGKTSIPKGCRWGDLAGPEMEGERLVKQYGRTLETLGKQPGMLGLIFRKAQNKIQDPARLRHLIVELVGKETWTELSADVKGDAYEGLLEKNAQETKGGAGQYFTPRALISAIVDVVRPAPGETICDPACGTGGFLLAAYGHVAEAYGKRLDRDAKRHLKYQALRGMELVDGVARLCAMNLFLHGIGPLAEQGETPVEGGVDSLSTQPNRRFDVVLTNPPFGKKSSITVVNEDDEEERKALTYARPDFWTTTSNKQLNFVQHVVSLLSIPGRAAVVVPDNVLFEGGAGETVRRRLLETCDVHTLLRLPTGLFYAQGVKANVLFFDRKPAAKKPWTSKVWVYDLRTNQHFTLKQKPLARNDLDEFVACYQADARHKRKPTWSEKTPDGRWRAFTLEELLARDKVSLDLLWLKDDSVEDGADLPAPQVLAAEVADALRSALGQIEEVLESLPPLAGDNPVARHGSDLSSDRRVGPLDAGAPRGASRAEAPHARRGR